jgi:hypothetical protein
MDARVKPAHDRHEEVIIGCGKYWIARLPAR